MVLVFVYGYHDYGIHQSGGALCLRIEDTDLKRSVEGGVQTIVRVFHEYEPPVFGIPLAAEPQDKPLARVDLLLDLLGWTTI